MAIVTLRPLITIPRNEGIHPAPCSHLTVLNRAGTQNVYQYWWIPLLCFPRDPVHGYRWWLHLERALSESVACFRKLFPETSVGIGTPFRISVLRIYCAIRCR
jgi:hypothetical protein